MSNINAAVRTARHEARLACITNAIDALGKLRNVHGFAIDSLPVDINAARDALWKAYHAELARKPAQDAAA